MNVGIMVMAFSGVQGHVVIDIITNHRYHRHHASALAVERLKVVPYL
jgi:hypothetical protein